MKKFKKLLSVVSATILCALPMINGVTVNAEDESQKLNTYVIYCDVEANSGVMWADLEFKFTGNIEDYKMETRIFGGNIGGGCGSRGDGKSYFSASFRADGAMISPGTFLKTTIWTNDELRNTMVELRTVAFDANRKYMGFDKYTATTLLAGDVNGDDHVT